MTYNIKQKKQLKKHIRQKKTPKWLFVLTQFDPLGQIKIKVTKNLIDELFHAISVHGESAGNQPAQPSKVSNFHSQWAQKPVGLKSIFSKCFWWASFIGMIR